MDADKLVDEYKNAISDLRGKYPGTRFIHMPVLLKSIQTGPKAFIKRVVGRSVGHDQNIKREQLNEKLRNEYEGKDPLFDLARIEPTFPDGTRSSFEKSSITYYSMAPEYTDDGGHLNQ